jgi:hypothetical protein
MEIDRLHAVCTGSSTKSSNSKCGKKLILVKVSPLFAILRIADPGGVASRSPPLVAYTAVFHHQSPEPEHTMHCWARYLLWLVIAALGIGNMLTACGQKGDLYLPDPQQEQVEEKA